jgi:hypothetical protein
MACVKLCPSIKRLYVPINLPKSVGRRKFGRISRRLCTLDRSPIAAIPTSTFPPWVEPCARSGMDLSEIRMMKDHDA